MNLRDIDNLIGDRVHDASHRVLVQARENVGECTYALFEPEYVAALHSLIHYQTHVTYRPEHPTLHWINHHLFNKVVFFYQRMYEQPCLICEVCRSRSPTWSDSDMDDFENLLSYLDLELASEMRTPISVTKRVPSWVAEWMHETFSDPWIRKVFWERSLTDSGSLPISS